MGEITVIGIILLFVYVVLAHYRPGIALLTVPFAAIALGWAADVYDQPENILFIPVLVLITLTVAAVARRNTEADTWVRLLATWLLIAIGVALFFAAALACFVQIGAGILLPLLFLFGLAAIIAGLAGYGIVDRRATTAVVFSTLGASMRQNLPLPMALECASNGRTDPSARTLKAIKKWLVQGYSLVESIQRGYPRCPSRFVAMLAAAEQVEQLPTAIVAIESDIKSQAIERHRFRPVHPFYPVIILSVAFLLLLGLMTFVVPQYKTVLEEMVGGRLPTSTTTLMEIMEVVRSANFWLVLTAVLFMALLLSLYSRSRLRRPDKPRLLSWIGDWVKWRLPVVHWFQNNGSLLQVVELLHLSLHAGSTVNDAIRATLQLDVNLHFRRRLKCWLRRVERGDAISTAAKECGLGAALAWAFDANIGDAPAVLEMLESFYRSNYSYRVNLTRFILWPCAIIGLGLVVGFIVYAIFSPGVQVLGSLAGSVYP
jgi:type II secretory pathway component PulF